MKHMQSSMGVKHASQEAGVYKATVSNDVYINNTATDKVIMLDPDPCVPIAFKAELQHIASMPRL